MYGFYQSHQDDFSCRETINNCYPSHLHKQVEIIYVTKGKLKSTINGKESLLLAGDLSICFPNIVHSTESIGNSIAILIIFDAKFIGAYSNELLNFYPEVPFIMKSSISEGMKSNFDGILHSFTSKEDLRISIGYLYIIFGNILIRLNLIKNKNVDLQDTCRVLLEFINNHFTEDISLNSLSNSLNISKYYISHIFSEKIKTSFPSYLNRCRIDYARNLLRNTNDSVTQIGFDCGFNSSRTFYRAFKECYHITPMEYRKNQGQFLFHGEKRIHLI